jgi:hypothetical protein
VFLEGPESGSATAKDLATVNDVSSSGEDDEDSVAAALT